MLKLYILNDPDKPNHCKVGITSNPYQRIRSYRTAAPNAKFYKLYDIPHRIHEKKILELIKESTIPVRSEYVGASPFFISRIIDGYMIDNDLDDNPVNG